MRKESGIEECKNKNIINGMQEVGGIVGLQKSDVKYCYNNGNILGSISQLGGIVGYSGNKYEISFCYNSGNVSIVDNSTVGRSVGGILGGTNTSIQYCGNIGKIYGEYYYGPIIGYLKGTMKNCYYFNNEDNKVKTFVSDTVAFIEKYTSYDNIESLNRKFIDESNGKFSIVDNKIRLIWEKGDETVLPVDNTSKSTDLTFENTDLAGKLCTYLNDKYSNCCSINEKTLTVKINILNTLTEINLCNKGINGSLNQNDISMLKKFNSLKILNLGKNVNLTIDGSFSEWKSLQELYLGSTKFNNEKLDFSNFKNLPNLIILNLDGNGFTSITNVDQISNKENLKLYLRNNKISDVKALLENSYKKLDYTGQIIEWNTNNASISRECWPQIMQNQNTVVEDGGTIEGDTLSIQGKTVIISNENAKCTINLNIVFTISNIVNQTPAAGYTKAFSFEINFLYDEGIEIKIAEKPDEYIEIDGINDGNYSINVCVKKDTIQVTINLKVDDKKLNISIKEGLAKYNEDIKSTNGSFVYHLGNEIEEEIENGPLQIKAAWVDGIYTGIGKNKSKKIGCDKACAGDTIRFKVSVTGEGSTSYVTKLNYDDPDAPDLTFIFKSDNQVSAKEKNEIITNSQSSWYIGHANSKDENVIWYDYTVQEGDQGLIVIDSLQGTINGNNVSFDSTNITNNRYYAITSKNVVAAGEKGWVEDDEGNDVSEYTVVPGVIMQAGEINFEDAVVNGDKKYTNSRKVYVKISDSKDVSYVFLSETNETPTASADGWEEYDNTMEFILSDSDGEKIVYAWVKDSKGNIEQVENIKDVITLDRVDPTIEITELKVGGRTVETTGGNIIKVKENDDVSIKFETSETCEFNNNSMLIKKENGEKVYPTFNVSDTSNEVSINVSAEDIKTYKSFTIEIVNSSFYDYANNYNGDSKEFHIEFDNTPPELRKILITSPKTAAYKCGQEVEIKALFDEEIEFLNVPVLKIKIGDSEPKECTQNTSGEDKYSIMYTYTIDEDDNGEILFDSFNGTVNDKLENVSSIDKNKGNFSFSENSNKIVADNTNPTIILDKNSTNNDWEQNFNVNITFNDNNKLGSYKYAWKDSEFSGEILKDEKTIQLSEKTKVVQISSPETTGRYKLYIICTDEAGNSCEYMSAEYQVDKSITTPGNIKIEANNINSGKIYNNSEDYYSLVLNRYEKQKLKNKIITSNPFVISIDDDIVAKDNESGINFVKYAVFRNNQTQEQLIPYTNSPSRIAELGEYVIKVLTKDNVNNVVLIEYNVNIMEEAQKAIINNETNPEKLKIKHTASVEILGEEFVKSTYYCWSTKSSDEIKPEDINTQFTYNADENKNQITTPDNLNSGNYYLYIKVIDIADTVRVSCSKNAFRVYGINAETSQLMSGVFITYLDENNRLLPENRKSIEDVNGKYINHSLFIDRNLESDVLTEISIEKLDGAAGTLIGRYLTDEGEYNITAKIKTKNDTDVNPIEKEFTFYVDKTAPKVTFESTEGYSNESKIKIKIEDPTNAEISSGIKSGTAKYIWNKNPNIPTKETFYAENVISINNETTLTPPQETGPWYLWVYVEDKAGNYSIQANNGTLQNGNVSLTDYTVPIAGKLDIKTVDNENYQTEYDETQKKEIGEYINKKLVIKLNSGYDLDSGIKSEKVELKVKLNENFTEENKGEISFNEDGSYKIEETGIYTLTIKTEDNLGNKSERAYEVKVDLSGPEIKVEKDTSFDCSINAKIQINDKNSVLNENKIKYIWIKRETTEQLKGDLNFDGAINNDDLELYDKYINRTGIDELEYNFEEIADLNKDSLIDSNDKTILYAYLQEVSNLCNIGERMRYSFDMLKYKEKNMSQLTGEISEGKYEIAKPKETGFWTLIIKAEDTFENKSEVMYNYQIDNTIPSKPTIYAFVENTIRDVAENVQIYSEQKTNKDVTVTVNTDSKAYSGIKKYEYRISNDYGNTWNTEWIEYAEQKELDQFTNSGKALVQTRATSNANLESEISQFVVAIDKISPEITFANSDNGEDGCSEWVITKNVTVSVNDKEEILVNTNTLKYYWMNLEDDEQPTLEDLTSIRLEQMKSFVNGQTIPTPSDASGNYVLCVYAEDVLGNVTRKCSKNYKIDTKIPERPEIILKNNSGELVEISNTEIELNVSGSTSPSGITYLYKINDEENWYTMYDGKIAVSDEGYNSVEVKAVNGVGKESNTSFESFTIDTTGPEVMFINDGTYGEYKNGEISTKVNVSDNYSEVNGTKLKYLWNNDEKTEPEEKSFVNTFTNETSISLPETYNSGIYYLWIYAEDILKNSNIMCSCAYYVDRVIPTIPNITMKTESGKVLTNTAIIDENVIVEISGSEAASGIDYMYTIGEGGEWKYYNSQNKPFISQEGSICIKAKAINGIGIESAETPNFTVTIDKSNNSITSKEFLISGVANEKYISGIMPGTTIESLLNNFIQIPTGMQINVYDENNNIITEGPIKTGMKVIVTNGDEKVEYTLIVAGDLTKTGSITLTDVTRAVLSYVGKITISKIEQKALDINYNGMVDLVDITKLSLVYAGNAKLK